MRLPKRKSVPFDFTFDSKKDGGKNEFDGAKSKKLSTIKSSGKTKKKEFIIIRKSD